MCKLDTGNSSSIQCLAQKGNNHFCFWNTKLLPMQAFCVTWFTWINSRYILEDEQPLQVENFSSQKKERDTYLYGRKIKQHLHKNIIQLSRKTSPLSMNNGLNFLFKMFKPPQMQHRFKWLNIYDSCNFKHWAAQERMRWKPSVSQCW